MHTIQALSTLTPGAKSISRVAWLRQTLRVCKQTKKADTLAAHVVAVKNAPLNQYTLAP
jgi:hypothetical protein